MQGMMIEHLWCRSKMISEDVEKEDDKDVDEKEQLIRRYNLILEL